MLQYQRCTRIALGLKKLMAGRRRALEETRAYVTHERCRGILSNDEIIKRGALAANGVTSEIHRYRSEKSWHVDKKSTHLKKGKLLLLLLMRNSAEQRQ